MALSLKLHHPRLVGSLNPYQEVETVIARARKSLCVVAGSAETPLLEKWLVAAKKRGVTVKVVLGTNGKAALNGVTRVTELKTISRDKFPIDTAFVIIDDQEVLVLSAPWKKSINDLTGVISVRVQNETVSRHFRKVFDLLFKEAESIEREGADAKFVPEFASDLDPVMVGPDQTVEVYFLPQEKNHLGDVFRVAMDEAEEELVYYSMAGDDDATRSDLRSQLDREVRVTLYRGGQLKPFGQAALVPDRKAVILHGSINRHLGRHWRAGLVMVIRSTPVASHLLERLNTLGQLAKKANKKPQTKIVPRAAKGKAGKKGANPAAKATAHKATTKKAAAKKSAPKPKQTAKKLAAKKPVAKKSAPKKAPAKKTKRK